MMSRTESAEHNVPSLHFATCRAVDSNEKKAIADQSSCNRPELKSGRALYGNFAVCVHVGRPYTTIFLHCS